MIVIYKQYTMYTEHTVRMHGKLINNRADRLCFCMVGPTFQECSISEFLKAASLYIMKGFTIR